MIGIQLLILFRMNPLGAAHGWEIGGKKVPLQKTCHTYPAIEKCRSYTLHKQDAKNMNHVTNPLSSADINIFFTADQYTFLYQEIQI